MMGIPTLVAASLVWLPAIASVVLSFFDWDGFGPLSEAEPVGLRWYEEAVTIYPAFWPAVQHNLIWLAAMFFVATPIGLLCAVLIDREASGTKFYQTSLYLPVVLSMALIGFVWQLMFSRDQGLINAVLGTSIDWYGDSRYNLWAALIATSWRHVGYVMLLYLAGLKGVDPALKEAAGIDGASEIKTFFHVTFPVMFPINVVVLVITFIDSLRAFDLVWVINRGRNGLELLATEVTRNIVGEAQRIGFGSALATIMLGMSSVFILIYLRIVMREEAR
ncbi:N-Acetyl-D-glucosamine ABC transport system, permease protein 1 [Luteococcus japonicus LSP_Lj1]|uniref:N-Acetyl-D-glucosamine ABC transport system, permease protein 1 n=2 Tax=Propionibacteriaceae TaxID=31957 RepID=A0A1R4KBA8_9ACTN|nr:N-Acetyl-D-glucosamine ABC transport system, permease protein 1 [Luteococcus japonicus LSP_Lj1]